MQIAQRRRPQRADDLRPGAREAKFGAILRWVVAVCAQAIEGIVPYQADAVDSAAVGNLPRCGDDPGIVKFMIGQQRSVVAFDAAGLADEQPQPDGLVCIQDGFRQRGVSTGVCLDVAVEARWSGHKQTLVRRDGLADIHEYPRDGLPVRGVHRVPGGFTGRSRNRSCRGRKPVGVRQVGQRAEKRGVGPAIPGVAGDEPRKRNAIAALFIGIFQR